MTLQSSGAISISQINAEFGRGNNLNSYRGTTWYTDAGGSGTFSSGAISVSDFYGKRLTSPTFSFTISSNQTNANLRTLAINAGWNQSSQLVATIGSGVYISSNSTGTPALTVAGSFPGGVQLTNNGTIVGMGGGGGGGSSTYGGRNTWSSSPGSPGGGGGTALSASSAVTVTNNGTIAGGGGGGGGGGGIVSMISGNKSFADYAGFGGSGGGGGRTGTTNSSGGSGGGGTYSSAYAGGSGTLTGPGTGGGSPYTVAKGGTGGGWGAAGAAGQPGTQSNPGSGGAGGAAVSGNSNISWVTTGTRYGAIT